MPIDPLHIKLPNFLCFVLMWYKIITRKKPILVSYQNSWKKYWICLPNTRICVSAGSLEWYFHLLNRVRSENVYLTGENLIRLLRSVSPVLYKITDVILKDNHNRPLWNGYHQMNISAVVTKFPALN
ncbi:unnamed protein product [Allacma fusca]|uniref:Uncharacterized protein n=1 Tax=Allacma fusca TaxID=39272 RepID=A0A8J2KHS2_9HEXA|nr:unnamed protein product [Allacma fusca]